MINGKQLDGLCKVLNVFQKTVRMDMPVVVDPVCTMICEVKAKDVFGIESSKALDIKQISGLKLEDEDFDVSIENGRYILSNDKRSYSILMSEGNSIRTPKVPDFYTTVEITTDANTFKKAIDKCSLVCDNCVIQNGNMTSKTTSTEVSVVLGKFNDDSGCDTKSAYGLPLLKSVAKVLTGKVTLKYDKSFPLVIMWNDGYYDYRVCIAPRVENDG